MTKRSHTTAKIAAVAMVLSASAPALAQFANEGAVPREPATVDTSRIFLDTNVSDVLVDSFVTVAVMDVSPRSPCPSNSYVFPRDEPKWLVQTGRLLEAMREPTPIRISFSCRDGMQVINAIQFLQPPRQVVRRTPRFDQSVEALQQRRSAFVNRGQVPVPGVGVSDEERLERAERIRRIPLP